jgi:hypothetical protein
MGESQRNMRAMLRVFAGIVASGRALSRTPQRTREKLVLTQVEYAACASIALISMP